MHARTHAMTRGAKVGQQEDGGRMCLLHRFPHWAAENRGGRGPTRAGLKSLLPLHESRRYELPLFATYYLFHVPFKKIESWFSQYGFRVNMMVAIAWYWDVQKSKALMTGNANTVSTGLATYPRTE